MDRDMYRLRRIQKAIRMKAEVSHVGPNEKGGAPDVSSTAALRREYNTNEGSTSDESTIDVYNLMEKRTRVAQQAYRRALLILRHTLMQKEVKQRRKRQLEKARDHLSEISEQWEQLKTSIRHQEKAVQQLLASQDMDSGSSPANSAQLASSITDNGTLESDISLSSSSNSTNSSTSGAARTAASNGPSIMGVSGLDWMVEWVSCPNSWRLLWPQCPETSLIITRKVMIVTLAVVGTLRRPKRRALRNRQKTR